MSNSNVDLSAELLSMIAKMYPNGTTLTINDGQVKVCLPQVPKKVIPSPVKKHLHIVSNCKYITDGEVEWDGDESFYLSSKEHGLTNVSLKVPEHLKDYFVSMLRGPGITEAGEVHDFEVELIHDNDNVYALFMT
jgi:hypothetical protein